MKSVFLSILMFIVVFTALKLNILRIFDHHIIVYTALISFIVVLACAFYFVGLPKASDLRKSYKKRKEERDNVEK